MAGKRPAGRARASRHGEQGTAGRPVTAAMARAWLHTVVSPILDALRVEIGRASSGNWSFRSSDQDFEYLWPVSAMIAPTHVPNLEQFWRFHPPQAAACRAHDEALDALRSACRDAFDRLRDSADFKRLARTSPDAMSVAERGDDRFFAEYVVNGLRDLLHGHTYKEFWREHGGEFLALRQQPGLKRYFDQVAEAGGSFRAIVERLNEGMAARQQSLADEFGLPPVDPGAN